MTFVLRDSCSNRSAASSPASVGGNTKRSGLARKGGAYEEKILIRAVLVMVLAMVPVTPAETEGVMVSTLAELDAADGQGKSITVKSGASITGTSGKSDTFASLTVQEGVYFKADWLTCTGSISVHGALETKYDIDCPGSFLLADSGTLTLGRRGSCSPCPAPLNACTPATWAG